MTWRGTIVLAMKATIDRLLFIGAYVDCGFSQVETAELLGLSIRTVRNKIKRYKIKDMVTKKKQKKPDKIVTTSLEALFMDD